VKVLGYHCHFSEYYQKRELTRNKIQKVFFKEKSKSLCSCFFIIHSMGYILIIINAVLGEHML